MSDALKEMYDRESVAALADAIRQELPAFDRTSFLESVFDDRWPDLALKQRMRHITQALGGRLPADYEEALAILVRVLPSLPDMGFQLMVFPDFVELYGLESVEASLAALERFTQFISAEFAVRPFIARYPRRTMAQMLAWTAHAHEAVRRLASEGSRPRLPWAMSLPAFKADPAPLLPILERLKDDPSESVRRSVANNLNDISKDHPELVISILNRWRQGADPPMQRLIAHALRTLVKAGHPEALALLGFNLEAPVSVKKLEASPQHVPMGGSVTISFELVSAAEAPLNLMVDYVLDMARARGKRSSKVFKLRKLTLSPGESISITKRHSFQPISTRRYYPGRHSVQIQVNGVRLGQVDFRLVDAEANS